MDKEGIFHCLHKINVAKGNRENKKKYFAEIYNELIKHVHCCIPADFLKLFLHSFIVNTNSEVYLNFFEKIYYKLSNDDKKNILLYLSYRMGETNIDILVNLFNDIIEHYIDNIDILKELCFLNTDYIKSNIDKKFVNIKYINKKIIKNNINKCYKYFDNLYKIKCIEKLSLFGELSTSQYDFLYDMLKHAEYIGYVIDIFLNSSDTKHIIKAYEVINYDKNTYYNNDNTRHYFKVTDTFIDCVKSCNANIENTINQIIEYSKKLDKEECKNINTFIKNILISNYKIKDIFCIDILNFSWSVLKEDEKYDFLIEMASDVEICTYGIIINMVTWIHYLDKGYFICNDETLVKYNENIEKLREQYSDDHEIWLDTERINALLL